ncbi:MAG: preprotein translocase subunit YajC [Bacteroidota bacterium]
MFTSNSVLTIILLQAGKTGVDYSQILMFGLLAVIFYFFMIRPQQKARKDAAEFINTVKKGDDVIMASGMHGKVVSIDDKHVVIDVDRGTKIKFEKVAISGESTKKMNDLAAKEKSAGVTKSDS